MECVWRAVMLLSVYKAVQLGNETSLWVLLTGVVLLQAQFLQIKKNRWALNKNMLLCPPSYWCMVLLNISVASKNKKPQNETRMKNPNWPNKQNPTKQNNPNQPNPNKQKKQNQPNNKNFLWKVWLNNGRVPV